MSNTRSLTNIGKRDATPNVSNNASKQAVLDMRKAGLRTKVFTYASAILAFTAV